MFAAYQRCREAPIHAFHEALSFVDWDEICSVMRIQFDGDKLRKTRSTVPPEMVKRIETETGKRMLVTTFKIQFNSISGPNLMGRPFERAVVIISWKGVDGVPQGATQNETAIFKYEGGDEMSICQQVSLPIVHPSGMDWKNLPDLEIRVQKFSRKVLTAHEATYSDFYKKHRSSAFQPHATADLVYSDGPAVFPLAEATSGGISSMVYPAGTTKWVGQVPLNTLVQNRGRIDKRKSFVTKLKSVDSTKGETELEMTVDISRLVRNKRWKTLMKTVAAKGYTKYFDDRLALLVCNVAEEQEQFDTRMRNMRLKHMKVFNDGAQNFLDNQDVLEDRSSGARHKFHNVVRGTIFKWHDEEEKDEVKSSVLQLVEAVNSQGKSMQALENVIKGQQNLLESQQKFMQQQAARLDELLSRHNVSTGATSVLAATALPSVTQASTSKGPSASAVSASVASVSFPSSEEEMASDKKTQQVPQEGLPTLVSPKLRLEVPAHLLKMETAEASATPHFDAREDANDAAALPSAPARVQVTQGVPGQVSERSRRQDGHLNGHQNRAPNDSNIQQEAALGSRSMLKLDQQSLWSLGDSRSQSPPKEGSYQRTVHFDAREDANDAAALPSAPARVQVTQGVPGQVSERSRRQDGHLNGHRNRAPNDSNIQQEAALGSRASVAAHERVLQLDQQSLWSLPVPIYGEEKVIVKEVTVPVGVVKEVAVPAEHVVTKEVHVPVEIGMRSETRVGESRVVIGEGDSRSQSPPKKGSYQRTVHARNNSSGRTIAPQTLPPLAPQNLPTQPEWQGHSYQHTVHARNNGSLDSSFNVLT